MKADDGGEFRSLVLQMTNVRCQISNAKWFFCDVETHYSLPLEASGCWKTESSVFTP